MEGAEAVHLVGGVGTRKLATLCRMLAKDVSEVEEVINDLDWMFSKTHPYLRPLLNQGFKVRTGVGLKEWERLMDLMLEVSRDLERTCLGDNEMLLFEQAQLFIEYYTPVMNALNMLQANLASIAKDARELSSDEAEIRSIETKVENQTRAVGDLITTMGALRTSLENGTWLTPQAESA